MVWWWLLCAVQLIKQSQDDGGTEVTWKISPVNDRLRTMKSRHFPGMTLHPCSNNEVHYYCSSLAYIVEFLHADAHMLVRSTYDYGVMLVFRHVLSCCTNRWGVVHEIANLLWVSDFSFFCNLHGRKIPLSRL